jgi:tripartite-type tricarboxylate transporter receptor subunit TctC
MPILERMNREIAAVLADGPLRARLIEMGAERVVANSVPEATRYVAEEMTRWGHVLRAAGVQQQ